jgi:hypothetical protein
MINAAVVTPLILATLFMASAAYVEFCRPGLFPRLTSPTKLAAPSKRRPDARIDPAAIAALTALDLDAELSGPCAIPRRS